MAQQPSSNQLHTSFADSQLPPVCQLLLPWPVTATSQQYDIIKPYQPPNHLAGEERRKAPW
jgi:hypothetical protein